MSNDLSKQELFGHPKGLTLIFFVEMWERFAYYGMRAILVLYMLDVFKYDKSHAYGIYGAFAGLIYATPLIGGLIADKFLGNRKCIITGSILMAIGYFLMAINHTYFFYAAIGFQIIGNGYYKANISTLVGKLYGGKDPRRDGAFTIFYMSVNLGAFISPLIIGYVGAKISWSLAFMITGIGMLIGLAIFIKYQNCLGGHGDVPRKEAFKESMFFGITKSNLWLVGTLLSVPLASMLVMQEKWVSVGVGIGSLVFLVSIVIISMKFEKTERGGVFTILILMFFGMSFWAFFEQAGTSMTVFAEERIDRIVFGWEVPAAWLQSINPFIIFVLGIPFSIFWVYLSKTRFSPSSPFKMALGFIQLAGGFYVLFLASKIAGDSGSAPFLLMVFVYFLHTTGELCFSPVGISAVSKLSPAKLSGLMMGAWLLSSSFAHIVAGVIAKMTSKDAGYGVVFSGITYYALGAGVLLMMLVPLMKKLVGKKI